MKKPATKASSEFFSLNLFKSWLPFLETVQTYNGTKFRLDLLAGLTVALVALPQAMAYAFIAGVEPQYGIYALIVGSIVAALFGSSRHLHTGPVNASSIVIAATMTPYIHQENYMAMVFLLALLAGVFQLGAGLFKLGNLAQFISSSVLIGFMAGAALLIIINQVPNLLGLPQSSGLTFLNNISGIGENIARVDTAAIFIGVGTVLLVLTINRLSPKSPAGIPYIPSYLLALLAAAGLVVLFGLIDKGIVVVGNIPAQLPPLSAPALDLTTINLLAASALALTVISISETIASAKSIGSLAGDKIDANQELVGQGLAKIAVAFFSGMPVSGSFTRTALNFRAGAQTRFAAVFSGILIFIIVIIFSPIARYIPVAALAGVIMVLVTNMVNWDHVVITLKTTKSDAVVMLATFTATLLFSLDTAIYIGVGLSLVLFLRKAGHPRLIELEYDQTNGFQEMKPADKRRIPEISIVHIEGDIFFGAAEFFENEIGRIASRPGLKVLILRVKSASCLDATSIMGLMRFAENMKKTDKLLVVSGVTGEVERVFRRSGLDKVVGKENIFFSDVAVLKSTKKALHRALEYVNSKGEGEYRVSLFYDRPDKAKVNK
ncbi:SulP family inorganic anion transporter [candidate division KSB1 bacterium]|nr:SulP family inorganic anion transporter [candidate division KSB1 bacterium]TDI86814.1 MAG: SulP family inorganic anion transporter [Caldithrix sp.]